MGFIYIEEDGLENINVPCKGAIVVSNHISFIEPFYYIYKFMATPIAAGEHLKVPLLGTIVKALSFLVSQNPQEIYQLKGLDVKHTASSATRVPVDLGNNELYPYMLCNIGSGVSILHVNNENDYKRVSGTALGGGTFFGLAKLLTKLRSFSECMEEAAVGDETTVNMLVKDIYGGRYGLELPGDFTASFFGKVGGSTSSTVGINGFLCNFISEKAYSRPPFLTLHVEHAVTTFSQSVTPPFDLGSK